MITNLDLIYKSFPKRNTKIAKIIEKWDFNYNWEIHKKLPDKISNFIFRLTQPFLDIYFYGDIVDW